MISTLAISAVLLVAPPVLDVSAPPPAPASVAPSAADSGLVVVPARLDLGTVERGSSVRASVWLVNTSSEPITVEKASAGCGCTTVQFTSATLAPGAAKRVWFDVKAAKKVTTKDVKVAFRPAWGDPVTLTTTIATADHAAPAPAPLAAMSDPDPEVMLVPTSSDLGSVAAGTTLDTTAWIINTGDTVAHVSNFKAGCGCTTAVGFAPIDVAPGMAQRVRLRVKPTAHAKSGPEKRVKLQAVVDGRAAPVHAALTMQVRERVASRLPD